MAALAEYVPPGAQDFRIYAFRALGGGRSTAEMVEMISRGFPVGKVIRLAGEYQIPEALLRKTLDISPSTLQRRKRSGRFSPVESDRFVRLAGLYGMAEDVLGGKPHAGQWMSAPNRSLGGKAPIDFAVTETGAREVENLLGRIAHGVAA